MKEVMKKVYDLAYKAAKLRLEGDIRDAMKLEKKLDILARKAEEMGQETTEVEEKAVEDARSAVSRTGGLITAARKGRGKKKPKPRKMMRKTGVKFLKWLEKLSKGIREAEDVIVDEFIYAGMLPPDIEKEVDDIQETIGKASTMAYDLRNKIKAKIKAEKKKQ